VKDSIQLIKIVLKAHKGLFLWCALIIFLFNISELIYPKIFQLFVDKIDNNALEVFGYPLTFLSDSSIWHIPALLLFFALLRLGISIVNQYYCGKLAQNSLFELRKRIFEHSQNLTQKELNKTHIGNFISNLIEDVNHVGFFFEMGIFSLFENAVFILCGYILIFMVSWPTGLASISVFIFGLCFLYLFFKIAYPKILECRDSYADMIRFFTESIDGQQVIKAFGKKEKRENHFTHIIDEQCSLFFHTWKTVIYGIHSLSILAALCIPVTLGVSLYLSKYSTDYQLSSGNILMIFFIQTTIVSRCKQLGRAADKLLAFMATAKRLMHLFNKKTIHRNTGNKEPIHQLSFENVSFSYLNERLVLKNITFQIDFKQFSNDHIKNRDTPLTYAIAGRTGSGKSTLLYLLGQFYAPDDGSIKANNLNINKMDYHYWRQKISYVFQETFLFDGSLKENILYGYPEASEEEFLRASECACVDDFIDQLSDGYQTRIGERGVTLSGGQKQRVGIARALLTNPDILLLDDCTAFLDNETEEKILKSIKKLKSSLTIITVSHRPKSLMSADHLIFLENGSIVESGSPNELININGPFSQMIRELNPKEHFES